MAKVNVNKQHDYITVRAVWSKAERINMTWSRYGEKVSFVGMSEPQARMVMRLMKLPQAVKTNGEWVDMVAKAAEPTTDAASLIAAIEALRTKVPAHAG